MSIVAMPLWKKGSTAEEWFMELAHLAREFPEDFTRAIVVNCGYKSEGGSGEVKVAHRREGATGIAITEALGLLRLGEVEFLRLSDETEE